jgi:mannose-6-phosphate isomerase-like protein (cupin superfamily)
MLATAEQTAKVLGPHDGKTGFLGSIGVRFMIDGNETGGGFSLAEKRMSPRALTAPMHRHEREDEYTYILEGHVGVMLGDEVVVGGAGDLIFRPRHQWHTFWNAGDETARILEILSPAGMEGLFHELVVLDGSAPPKKLGELYARYGLEAEPDSIPRLVERFDLRFPGERI